VQDKLAGNCTQADVGASEIPVACNVSCSEEKDWAKGTDPGMFDGVNLLVALATLGTGEAAAPLEDASVTLYRAVSRAELASIESSGGAFSNVAASGGGKYFSLAPQGAAYVAKAFGSAAEPRTIVATEIRASLIPADASFVERGIGAVRLPARLLPHLSPARLLNYSPVP